MLNILRQRKEVVVGFRAALLFSLIITLAGFSVPLAYAQQGTGNIIGVVRDPSGAAVVGATVDIENVDRRDVVHLTTNGAGFYSSREQLQGHGIA